MNYSNYIKINTNNLIENIDYFKNHYSYPHIIFNVSNNAFGHGMYIINYLKDRIDYLYVNNFDDLKLIRKYNKNIPVIFDGFVNADIIYDLIISDAIVVIRDLKILKEFYDLNIKDKLHFILCIDPKGYYGIYSRQDIIDYLELDHKYLELIGVIANINEKNFDDFKHIVKPINNVKLMILNNEENKRKILGSNSIILDSSIYGINLVKKKLFQKNELNFKQIFSLNSKIILTKKIVCNKKEKYVAIVPFGYNHGMNRLIKNVFIKNKMYKVKKILSEYMVIEVDEDVTKDMNVEIISSNNPLENYFFKQTLNYFSLFNLNIPIVFDDYILEKTLIY